MASIAIGTLLYFLSICFSSNPFTRHMLPVYPFLILFVLGLCVRQFASRSNTAGLLAISTTLFGLMYVPWLLNFVQKINFFPGIENGGKFYVLYFILVTKFSDTGAYAAATGIILVALGIRLRSHVFVISRAVHV